MTVVSELDLGALRSGATVEAVVQYLLLQSLSGKLHVGQVFSVRCHVKGWGKEWFSISSLATDFMGYILNIKDP